MLNQCKLSPLYLFLSPSTNSYIIITLHIGGREIKLSCISEGKKNLVSEKGIRLVTRNPGDLSVGLTLAGLGKLNLSICTDLSDFPGKVKVFDKMLSEIGLPDFNVIMVYCFLYIHR